MADVDPLTAVQRQRLAVLYATRDALLIELDALDLTRCAHWVASGEELPTPLKPITEHVSCDAATWTSAVY